MFNELGQQFRVCHGTSIYIHMHAYNLPVVNFMPWNGEHKRRTKLNQTTNQPSNEKKETKKQQAYIIHFHQKR